MQAAMVLDEHAHRRRKRSGMRPAFSAKTLADAGVAAWEFDLATRCFVHPTGLLRVLGRAGSASGLSAEQFYCAVLSGERPTVRNRLEAAIAGAHTLSLSFQIALADGATACIAMCGCPFRRRDRQRLAGIAFGIAESCNSELEALRKADRVRNEFIATMAHELSSPLAAVLCAGELVGKAAPAGGPLAVAGAALQRQARHLAQLVDEMRNIGYTGIGRPGPNVCACLFDDVLRDAIEQATPRITARAHRFIVEAPARGQVVGGNFTQLVQIIANLLNNASKYTPDGGTIRVWVETRGALLRCTISDNGIGMVPEFLGRAFEPFVQADAREVHAGSGIGLGLKLVRELAEIHGGTVSAHSAGSGCGSTFVLELPLEYIPDGG